MQADHASGPAPAPGWDVEVIADSDSRWKWGATLARRLAPQGPVRVHATLLRGASCPSERQLADVGEPAATVHRLGLGEAARRLATTDAQVVVLACIGGGVQALLHALARAWAGRARRPVVVTGYVGLVYEKTVDGLLLRAGADVVLANSAADTERFRAVYRAAGADPDSIVRTALPFLGGAAHDPQAAGRDRPFTLTYVTQPGVPATKAERRYALTQAARHARRHPDRRVIVKLRARAGERTTHVEPYPLPGLVAAHELPGNLEFVHGPMAPVLDRTDLCVTVSSTAALEAVHRGIPTAVLTDFGVRESLGNHLFLGCGAFASWTDLHDGARPTVDPGWAERNGALEQQPYAAAAARVADLVAARDALAPLRPMLSVGAAGCYLPALLARNGLRPDGCPLPAPTPVDSPLRTRAVRAAARRAYGVGVRVLEPRIRRMAQW